MSGDTPGPGASVVDPVDGAAYGLAVHKLHTTHTSHTSHTDRANVLGEENR
ncbi:hypothetical protein GCM10011366_13610 [Ornithinimicrobium tianjinense]|uniref:Uncharacterized protein n=1 Tax=Ornithinimicrobium tianjinense TaxID=1195761 RepID=A0A917F3N5_9MICO|nr:hypothetical protein GCM10011366_13610 [Ornithinimicrobium tianjinense]